MWHKALFEAVRGHYIHRFVQQLLTLASRQVAHRSEAVTQVGCFLLSRVLADHIQFLSHLVALEGIKAVVEGFVVTGYTATYAGSVGGEECTDSRTMLAQVENGEGRLPLVAVHNGGRHIEVLVQTLCHLTYRVGKEATLIVVTVGGMALDTIFLPHMSKYLVFLCPEFVPAKEYGNRFARHLPTTNAYTFRAPTLQERLALLEGEIGVFAEVWTEKYDFVFMFCLHRGSTRREDGINAAYTIAYLPTGLENILRLHDYFRFSLTTMRSISLKELYNIGEVAN